MNGGTLSIRTTALCALVAAMTAACQTNRDRQSTGSYAAWSGVDTNGSWTRAAESAVAATSLTTLVPADVRDFCPAYNRLEKEARIRFWAGLMSAMAKFESDFNPDLRYTESIRDTGGNRVVSRGLLQLSVESANQPRYACRIANAADLHDPDTNLRCGARILSTWVERDGVVAGVTGNFGGARYWAVLRPTSKALPEIRELTRDFEFCRTPRRAAAR